MSGASDQPITHVVYVQASGQTEGQRFGFRSEQDARNYHAIALLEVADRVAWLPVEAPSPEWFVYAREDVEALRGVLAELRDQVTDQRASLETVGGMNEELFARAAELEALDRARVAENLELRNKLENHRWFAAQVQPFIDWAQQGDVLPSGRWAGVSVFDGVRREWAERELTLTAALRALFPHGPGCLGPDEQLPCTCGAIERRADWLAGASEAARAALDGGAEVRAASIEVSEEPDRG